MYISEFVCGLIIGAVAATALIVSAALWWDRHNKTK